MFVLLRTQRGFSLIELLLAMAIFVVLIWVIGTAFQRVLPVAMRSTRTAESDISGIVGLELLRSDLESAGYGLPWSFSEDINYDEAKLTPGSALNDDDRNYADPSQFKVPRAVATIEDADPLFSGSDVLTIRSQSVAANATSRKWTYVESGGTTHTWSGGNLEPNDRVVLIRPIKNFAQSRELVVSTKIPGKWSTTFNNYSTEIGKPDIYSLAEGRSDTYIIYGVDGGVDLSMPFNRADFFIRKPTDNKSLPQRCNLSTGILYKNIVNQDGGGYISLPIFECALDMQVVFDKLVPGAAATIQTSSIDDLSPQEIREQLRAIRVYILTHDGGPDRNYSYPTTDATGKTGTILVGPGAGTGRLYTFNETTNANWRNYRWRIYQIVARPSNLTGNIVR